MLSPAATAAVMMLMVLMIAPAATATVMMLMMLMMVAAAALVAMVLMMVAVCGLTVCEASREERFHDLVRFARNTSIKLNSLI